MTRPNREYKNSMFKDLFNEEATALKLYNALTDRRLTLDDGMCFTTLENALFMDRLNDISFTIGDKLVVLIEHQSSVNENMPLRALIYIGRVYEKIIERRSIYRSTLITIPTPEFFVLYNGVKDHPDDVTLKLSKAFRRADSPDTGRHPELDLEVRVLNINKGHNEKILEKCNTLRDYAAFIGQVRERQQAGQVLEDAIMTAIDFCIANGILVEYLEKNSSEVRNMIFTEFNLEEAKEVWHEEGREEGRKEEREEVARSLLARGMALLEVAEIVSLPVDKLQDLT